MRMATMVTPYARPPGRGAALDPGSALPLYARSLAQAEAALGYDVNVVGPHFAGASPWHDGSVSIHSGFRHGRLDATFRIERAVRAIGEPVIHLQHELFAFGGIATALALPVSMHRLRRRGYRFLTTLHGVIPRDAITRAFVRSNGLRAPLALVRAAWHELLLSICHRSDVIHVHEAEHARWLRDDYNYPGPIEIVPMGTGLAFRASDRDESRERLGISPSAHVLLFFGYLLERKGIVPFLAAVPGMLADDPDLTILLVGVVPDHTPASEALGERIEALARHPRLRRLGFVPDAEVATVFDIADALILPYTFTMSASFPLSIALGRGTPVLLSRTFAGSYAEAPSLFAPDPLGIRTVVKRFFSDAAFRSAVTDDSTSRSAGRSWHVMATRLGEIVRGIRDRSERGA